MVIAPLFALTLEAEPLDLTRLKDVAAYRSSSINVDPAGNDLGKRPIPGETTVLADLEGLGVVTHIWVTIAANEYAWLPNAVAFSSSSRRLRCGPPAASLLRRRRRPRPCPPGR